MKKFVFRFLTAMSLIFLGQVVQADVLAELKLLPLPKKISCHQIWSTAQSGVHRANPPNFARPMDAERTSFYEFITKLINQQLDAPDLLSQNGYHPSLLDGSTEAKLDALKLSSNIHKIVGEFIPSQDRTTIAFVNDRVLAHINNQVHHINVFYIPGFSRFIELANKLPVDSEGRALPTVEYGKALEIFNNYLFYMHELYLGIIVDLEKKLESLARKDSKNWTIADSQEILYWHRVVQFFIETKADFYSQRDYLFNAFPSPVAKTTERVSRRVELSASKVDLVLGVKEQSFEQTRLRTGEILKTLE